MEKKTFRVEKGRGKAKVVQFIELTKSDEDIKKLASFAWFGWKIEEVKKWIFILLFAMVKFQVKHTEH